MSQLSLFSLFKSSAAPLNPGRDPYVLDVDGLAATVQRKPVRWLRLSLLPDGSLQVSAPLRTADKAIFAFVLSRREWIEAQRFRLASTPVPPKPSYLDGELLPFWDGHVTLRVREGSKTAKAALAEPGILVLNVPKTATQAQRETAVRRWYARELLKTAANLLPARQMAMGVRAKALKVRSMRSRWGTCNSRTGTVTLALELARRPPEALDYVLTHELTHLITLGHGKRFKSILDRHLPEWRVRRKKLNQGPPPS